MPPFLTGSSGLEQIWEHTPEASVQQRIELLIHRVNFRDLQADFSVWAKAAHPELLRGALLIARYQFPDLDETAFFTKIDMYRKSVWLEMNSLMTPLEQVNVINSVLYHHYKIGGHELAERKATHFFVNNLLDSRQGNAYSIGVLYLYICEMMDIPVFAVEIPRLFIFAYIDTVHNYIYPDREGIPQLHFYIDPATGVLYNQEDVLAYLKKINASGLHNNITPLSSKQIIRKMLQELVLCYQYNKEDFKAADIESLIGLLND